MSLVTFTSDSTDIAFPSTDITAFVLRSSVSQSCCLDIPKSYIVGFNEHWAYQSQYMLDMLESEKIDQSSIDRFFDRLVDNEVKLGSSESMDAIGKAISSQFTKAETAVKKYEEEL